MDDGSQTGLAYARHMYILQIGGTPGELADYDYVGQNGQVYVEANRTKFHIGATIAGELVCEATVLSTVPNTFLGGIAISEVPEPVLREALDRSLDANAALSDRQQLVVSLIQRIPDFAEIEVEFPGAIGLSDVFSADGDLEAAKALINELNLYIKNLRERLGYKNTFS